MAEWRTVEGFGSYRVSDQGQVMRGFRYLKPTPRNGYARVCLSKNGDYILDSRNTFG